MPYLDRQNRICGFLDIEENETCGKFLRRYFILDTQANCLLWYMDNPQNLAIGAGAVGSLQLTYISKVSVATPKQKPKTPFCFVINALSQRYFLQASDQKDLQDWVEALNRASKITVPKGGSVPPAAEVAKPPAVAQAQEKKPPVAYKTEIIGGVVVHTPISISQNGGEGAEGGGDLAAHPLLRRSQSYIPASAAKPPAGPPVLKSGYCVKQGNVRKSWKRRYFVLDEFSISYFKCEQDKEPLRSILLKDVCKTHECLRPPNAGQPLRDYNQLQDVLHPGRQPRGHAQLDPSNRRGSPGPENPPQGNLLHEVHVHDQAWRLQPVQLLNPFLVPAEAAGGGAQGALQSPLDLGLAAVDARAAAGGQAARGGGDAWAAEGLGVPAGLRGARRCRRRGAGQARAAQIRAPASEGEAVRLRPGRRQHPDLGRVTRRRAAPRLLSGTRGRPPGCGRGSPRWLGWKSWSPRYFC
ncbi:pleckstrin homology domain-containing family A member 2 isoform X1 [Rhea pennata]|uniref:pleckstrin homology domain-containing family A member 2 isoform X1 n=1 Tax=Rhea pennata TaxID=8795 RepID=UPI002E269D9D